MKNDYILEKILEIQKEIKQARASCNRRYGSTKDGSLGACYHYEVSHLIENKERLYEMYNNHVEEL